VNGDTNPRTGPHRAPATQAQELADCLSLLEDVDRRVTAEHVAARFSQLLAHIASGAPGRQDHQPQASAHVTSTRAGSRRRERPGPAGSGTPDHPTTPVSARGPAAARGAHPELGNLNLSGTLAGLRAGEVPNHPDLPARLNTAAAATAATGEHRALPGFRRERRRNHFRQASSWCRALTVAAAVGLITATSATTYLLSTLRTPTQTTAHQTSPPAPGQLQTIGFPVPGTIASHRGNASVRSGPGNAYQTIGQLAPGAIVWLICFQQGTAATGPEGQEMIWYRLNTGGFVPGAWVDINPENGPLAACDPFPPEQPGVHRHLREPSRPRR
jgi:hypothetical protein